MLPASPSAQQATPCRLSAPGMVALLCATSGLVLAQPASAQQGVAPGVVTAQDETGTAATQKPQVSSSQARSEGVPGDEEDKGRIIDFQADIVKYDNHTNTMTASGHVLLRSRDQSLRADSIAWNRTTGIITAHGHIRMIDTSGDEVLTDRITLTDKFRTGAMDNLLIAFREGSRVAADHARREANGNLEFTRAVFSSCPVEDSKGCPKTPSWEITAARVSYDDKTKDIHFHGAFFEMFGKRLIPLPGLTISATGEAKSGFTVPDIGLTASNGFEANSSYYWRIASNRDLLLSGYVYTAAAPMISAQYRQLNSNGAFQITGYGTYSTRLALNSTTPSATQDLRGYIFANGRWQIDPNWSFTTSIRVASDRTFLSRYDISYEDRLRSTFDLQRIGRYSYFSFSGWATQALLVPIDQGQVPLALPILDYRRLLKNPVLGGRVEFHVNTLAITRAQGQDTQRAFASARWDLRRITRWGQEVTLTGLVRGDVYHSSGNQLTSIVRYRGDPGWQTRGVALAALDVKWPLIGKFMGGSQIITPRIQFVAAPNVPNFNIPNEDSRAIELDDSNLFSLSRFPGYDRVEDGVRMTYGVDWQTSFPNWRLEASIGQSYRFTNEPNLFPVGTGLNRKLSDLVGRIQVRYKNFLKLTHRFRLDRDTLAFRRNEIDATVGSDSTYVEIGYLRVNTNIDPTLLGLQNTQELNTAGRVAFARYWSIFGSAVVNLTTQSADPTQNSSGFQPLRTRLGIAYSDNCLEMGLTWQRNYIQLADSRRGNSFQIYIHLRNIGFR